ncbi:undecaprenyl-diphosphate phosphatase [Pandoraea nosoerga]|uniref:Undecaprenyl-diphosphatase n=1 Tax=Pandoraea nosoerga TaxID=2508296 RepID=A0A5E4UDQ8_9BURK|nr:undecaprenyl-diphosphate phosphatase [Pandoraea nosoerga]MBN4667131.1 undecaprenyl-diphosphate phosphatase [Pandoraea nosoerga]MBN4677119.1 undecaprenyl-diphosphate phosphatase [Pandoraea nosoerga]MBN4681844.1 undecaprenyl-diphosphate phosphatase [Pandoraea nosoerga]MBN4746236.1 undecaprenyl-diphosphate phosphatase [Pandoraea nosoerga]VVD97823.1 UDP-diphosphatase [Pandoraea nosoerga]
MDYLQVLVLAIVQGIAELLPVSSSAHVIMAEKLMGLDPSAPAMTLLLVMLHTGTMLAVIVYFWKSWRARYFSSKHAFVHNAKQVVIATAFTGVIGLALMLFIEKGLMRGSEHAEIEHLFGNLYIISAGLAMAGLLILISGRKRAPTDDRPICAEMRAADSAWIGAVQGLCLPLRGFSRSGSTISTGMLRGLDKVRVEEFSFALAVVLTPPVIVKEAYRLYSSGGAHTLSGHFATVLAPCLAGMVFSFLAGLIALRWLSRWLEHGRWYLFGIYCLAASAAVLAASQVM